MLQIPNYSGRHPELTTPNRLVGPVRLSDSLLSPWLDEHLPCWALNHHAFGPLFTDPETHATGRDCYRCGRWFPGVIPDGRRLVAEQVPSMVVSKVDRGFHFWHWHHGKSAVR